jgi:transforming growth factor-beta-induced protein
MKQLLLLFTLIITFSANSQTTLMRIHKSDGTKQDYAITSIDSVTYETSTAPQQSIADIVSNNPNFSILKAAVVKAGLVSALSSGALTVFAPDNEAFAASGISEATINSLDVSTLTNILLYHVLGTTVSSSQVPTSVTGVNTLLNINLYAVRTNNSVSVNNITVKAADITATNGVIHVISSVLMPATIKDIVVLDPNFSILKAAVVRAGLADAVATGSLTVFAPDNAAFAASGIDEAAVNSLPLQDLTNILLYHVVGAKVPSSSVPASDTVNTLLTTNLYASKNTNGVFMNGIAVKAADVQAANGVIHVVSKVLIPPTKTIAELVAADPELSLLLAAVVRAGLAGAVSGEGKFTVFAPTNDAFIAAGFPDVATIDAAPVDAVASIVKAHLFGTNVFASDLTAGATVPTLETDKSLVVGLTPPSVKIDGSDKPASNIILSGVNITATNGVIHKIDRVLLP